MSGNASLESLSDVNNLYGKSDRKQEDNMFYDYPQQDSLRIGRESALKIKQANDSQYALSMENSSYNDMLKSCDYHRYKISSLNSPGDSNLSNSFLPNIEKRFSSSFKSQ